MFFRGLILLAALVGCGCQPARFYTQAIGGQWEIISGRETVTKIIREEPPTSRLRSQLELVQQLRAFAATNLALPAGRQYEAYVDLKRPYVVWNVEATPEFSFESKSWWYPFVGRLEYQGYFRKELAVDYAAKLRAAGLDVFIGGVNAYSTLGWFNDPVLNTFVYLPEAELAELLFHELAHQELFIPGDTDFNEAFATSVGREGVRRWFAAKHDQDALARFLRSRTRDDQVVELILSKRGQLEFLYDLKEEMSGPTMRARKLATIESLRAEYAALKKNWPGYVEYDGFMAAPINNAQLNAVDTYYDLVPNFETMIANANGDLAEFYEKIKRTKKMDKEERRAFLNQGVKFAAAHTEQLAENP
jgi:predicted aminopeptidase